MCPVGEGNGVDLCCCQARMIGGQSIEGGIRWSSCGTAHVGGHGLVAAETLSGAAALPQGRLKELAAIGRVRSVASLGEVPLEAVAHAGEVSAISCAEAPEVRVVGASVLPLGFRAVEAVRACIGRVRLPLLGSGAAAQTELLQVRFGWACFGRCCVDRRALAVLDSFIKSVEIDHGGAPLFLVPRLAAELALRTGWGWA